jgi:L-xylulokinase
MVCDLLQMPLELSSVSEPGALGAAICAAIAGGAYDGYESAVANMVHMKEAYLPDRRKKEIYREKFGRYEKALAALDIFYSE